MRNRKINLHVKVRNFAELAPNIGFSEFDFYDLYRSTFENSELGRMKKLLPHHAMAENFGLVSKSLRPKLGRRSYFTPEGKVGIDVPEDVHGSELSEVDGAVERQHPLQDVLRRDNRSDSTAGKLQTAG